MNQNFVIVVLACFATMETIETKRASELARAMTSIQYDLALKVGNLTAAKQVYLFDYALFFNDAQDKVIDCIRYKEKNGRVAVLSQACQRVLQNSNEYVQFSTNPVVTDSIGVYVSIN
jgi:hypothetical protein